MRLIFLSLILLCLTPIILNSSCTIKNSNSEEISIALLIVKIILLIPRTKFAVM